MLSLLKANLLSLSRDKGSLFFTLIFPTLLVFILGTMLSSLDNPDPTIQQVDIAYYVDTTDPQVQASAEQIIKEFDGIDQVGFSLCSDPALAQGQLLAGEISAFIVFKEPFAIEIHDGLDATKNKAVHAIFTSVSRTYGCVATVMSAAATNTAASAAADSTSSATTASNPAASAAPNLSGLMDNTLVQQKTFGVSRSMMDYYAITMIVMMFFMGSFMGGAMSFYNDRKNGTLRRVMVTPLRRSSVFLQYMASLLPLNVVQVLIVMVVSSTVFGAHYAASWPLNVLLFAMLLLTGMASSSVSLLIGIYIKVNPGMVLMPIMWPLLFLSGTFSKQISIPHVTPWLPPNLIQQAAFDLTLFGRTASSLWVIAVCVALIIASALAGSVILNRKEMLS